MSTAPPSNHISPEDIEPIPRILPEVPSARKLGSQLISSSPYKKYILHQQKQREDKEAEKVRKAAEREVKKAEQLAAKQQKATAKAKQEAAVAQKAATAQKQRKKKKAR